MFFFKSMRSSRFQNSKFFLIDSDDDDDDAVAIKSLIDASVLFHHPCAVINLSNRPSRVITMHLGGSEVKVTRVRLDR